MTKIQEIYDYVKEHSQGAVGHVTRRSIEDRWGKHMFHQARPYGFFSYAGPRVKFVEGSPRPVDTRGRPRTLEPKVKTRPKYEELDDQLMLLLNNGTMEKWRIELKFRKVSPSRLRRAVRRLGIIVTYSGKQPHRIAWWSLPPAPALYPE